ncbi:MAG: Bacterial regulatory protein Fis family [Acidobacteriota bacterium]|nr:Bacterial regulatory protein Fis family [Acidobacteriota bacterium]
MSSTDKCVNVSPCAAPKDCVAQGTMLQLGTPLEANLGTIRELILKLWKQTELIESPAETAPVKKIKLRDEMRRFETCLIIQALNMTGGHQFRAARLLGLRPTTLHSKMKRYGIRVPETAERVRYPRRVEDDDDARSAAG